MRQASNGQFRISLQKSRFFEGLSGDAIKNLSDDYLKKKRPASLSDARFKLGLC